MVRYDHTLHFWEGGGCDEVTQEGVSANMQERVVKKMAVCKCLGFIGMYEILSIIFSAEMCK